ncbi:MAG: hypothetical protein IJ088_04215, partial [Clostridia bacterium]|nr:hypothetical protein [Clostridia bacterium]
SVSRTFSAGFPSVLCRRTHSLPPDAASHVFEEVYSAGFKDGLATIGAFREKYHVGKPLRDRFQEWTGR